jgi:hypothetical protein
LSRTLASTVVSHVTGSTVKPAFFAQFRFDSGRLNFWSGVGTIAHNVTGDGSEGWTGAGNLWGISPIDETDTIRATGVDLSLSGLNSDILSVALSEDYQDRVVILWLGFMNDDDTVLGVVEIFRGRCDVMSINDTGDTATLSMTAESVLIGLEKQSERRFTTQDQQIDFASDTGFDGVPGLQVREVVWGKSS